MEIEQFISLQNSCRLIFFQLRTAHQWISAWFIDLIFIKSVVVHSLSVFVDLPGCRQLGHVAQMWRNVHCWRSWDRTWTPGAEMSHSDASPPPVMMGPGCVCCCWPWFKFLEALWYHWCAVCRIWSSSKHALHSTGEPWAEGVWGKSWQRFLNLSLR